MAGPVLEAPSPSQLRDERQRMVVVDPLGPAGGLAYDSAGTIAAAKDLFEEAIFAGIPINVTLLFSREHYFAAAGAFMRGITVSQGTYKADRSLRSWTSRPWISSKSAALKQKRSNQGELR
jgi:hypothetical protein